MPVPSVQLYDLYNNIIFYECMHGEKRQELVITNRMNQIKPWCEKI